MITNLVKAFFMGTTHASPDINDSRPGVAGPTEPPWLHRAEVIVYVFLFTCISSGLFYVYYAAFDGKVLNALIGAAVTIGGSGAALLMLALVRMGSVVVQNSESIEQLSRRVDSLEDMLEAALETVPNEQQSVVEANLSDVGVGDPHALVAATAPRDEFPRLATPDEAHAAASRTAQPAPDAAGKSNGHKQPQNPEEQWQRAFERGDIRTCRRILAQAGPLIPPNRRAAMSESLDMLLEDRKQTLREEFCRLVRTGHFGQAIAKGKQIAETFPNSAMAAEFERIQPHLVSQAARQSPRTAEG